MLCWLAAASDAHRYEPIGRQGQIHPNIVAVHLAIAVCITQNAESGGRALLGRPQDCKESDLNLVCRRARVEIVDGIVQAW